MSDNAIRVDWRVTHGMTGTPIYRIWIGMKVRCMSTQNKAYPAYGGRGIKICKRWLKFANFFADMGKRPKGKVLDRMNNDGPYSPTNCRWATPKESANNRGNSRWVTIKGEKLTLTEWCKRLAVPYGRVKFRVYVYGWNPIDALFAPIYTKIRYYQKRGATC